MTKPLARRSLAALVLAVALLAAASPPAHAGTYALVACADLAGALGSHHVARPADGWFLEQGVYPSRDECAAGRAGRGLFATGDHGSNLFRLDAPADTSIARAYVTYRAHLPGAKPWAVPTFVVQAGHRGGWEYIGPARGYIGAEPIDFGGDAVGGNAHGADALRVGTRCGGRGPCDEGGQPVAEVRAVAVVLRDDRAPRVTLQAPGGHVQGVAEVGVGASDQGGGVFSRSLAVDGQARAGGSLCPTVAASVGAMRHVVRRVPCPLDAPLAVRLDTRALDDGPHGLHARVEDVAGNLRSAEARILIDNRPPHAGSVGVAGRPEIGEALTAAPAGFSGEEVDYEYRWQRCDAAGGGCAEIGGAVRRTYVLHAGDAGHRLRALVAASDGGGTVRVASAATGLVPAPQQPAHVSVPAGAPPGRLTAWLERGGRRLRRTTVRWPARVRIRGRLTDLAGRPLPRTAVRMLERVDGRRWRAITGVRTRGDGRLTAFTRIGPSRRVRLAYGRSAVTLRLRVRAHARVRVRRIGPLTILSGRLLGGRVPFHGIRLRLQSRRGPGPWSTRLTLHTDAFGRFSARGRATPGVHLRIAIPQQRGYPFAPGVARP